MPRRWPHVRCVRQQNEDLDHALRLPAEGSTWLGPAAFRTWRRLEVVDITQQFRYEDGVPTERHVVESHGVLWQLHILQAGAQSGGGVNGTVMVLALWSSLTQAHVGDSVEVNEGPSLWQR